LLGEQITAVAIPFGSYNRRVMKQLNHFSTIYTSDGGFAGNHHRVVPRESFNQNWHGGAVTEKASRPDVSFRIAKKRLGMVYKRYR
jgi:hypothetical protein